jgi:hypothetical protein
MNSAPTSKVSRAEQDAIDRIIRNNASSSNNNNSNPYLSNNIGGTKNYTYGVNINDDEELSSGKQNEIIPPTTILLLLSLKWRE